MNDKLYLIEHIIDEIGIYIYDTKYNKKWILKKNKMILEENENTIIEFNNIKKIKNKILLSSINDNIKIIIKNLKPRKWIKDKSTNEFYKYICIIYYPINSYNCLFIKTYNKVLGYARPICYLDKINYIIF